MELSVIIVTWNALEFTRECLKTIDNQEIGVPMEVIVVDNASSDGTPQMLREGFPHVRLIESQENRGFAAGNNIGIRASEGRYVYLINSDVSVRPGCFETLYEFMETNPSVGIAGPKMLGKGGETRRSSMRFPTLWNTFCRATALDSVFAGTVTFGGLLMTDFRHDRVAEVDVLNGWFWVARRSAIDQVGPLDERFFMYGEDIEWCYRFRLGGWKTVFCPTAEAIHYGGASSRNAPIRYYIEMRKANEEFWRRYHNLPERAAYRILLALHETIRMFAFSCIYAVRRSSRAEIGHKIRRSASCLMFLTGAADASHQT